MLIVIVSRLQKSARELEKASAAHQITILDSASAQATVDAAETLLLQVRQQLAQARIALEIAAARHLSP